MAALRVATRRHYPTTKPASLLRLQTLLFSSEPDQPIKPVSYAPKPKPADPDSSPETPLSREDARFVKDLPPTSYPSRFAPLPDDRPAAEPRSMPRFGGPGRLTWKSPEQVEEERLSAAATFPELITPVKREPRLILDLAVAIHQVKSTAKCDFDETVEAHVKLGIDAKRVGKGVRGSMRLPHGSGKAVKVAFFAEGKLADEARAAGVDVVGGAELVEEIAGTKKLNFDKCFATTEMVLRMGKISRILRERGLWPDRKLGTVTNDVSEALEKVRQGHTEFKMDKTAIVHAGVGKVSFSEDRIRENIGAFVNALLLAKPAGLKKTSKYAGYIESFHICSTMGAGFPVSIQSVSKAADNYNKLQLK